MPRVLDRGIIPAAKIVVVSVFRQIQAVTDSAFNGIIRVPVEVEQAGVLIDTAADTVFAEVIPINAIIVVVAFLHIAEARITVAQRIEVILFAVNRIPFFLYEGRPVIISGSQIGRQPFTLQQLASVECVGHILKERPALAVQSFEGFLVKVVIAVLAVLIRQVPPTGLGHAVDGVIARAVQLDQPRDLTLARAGHLIEPIEILAALVVQAGDLVHALQRAVPDEVIGRAVDRSPARPGGVVQNEAVREVLIRFAVEMAAAGVRGIFRLLIGIDPILLLEGGLVGHAVKRVRAQIDVVADRTGVLDAQALRLVPLRAVLCGQLHAGEDADGVGRIGGDGLTLLDEIALHRQHIVLVHACGRQAEIIVGNGQVGNIHADVLVKPDRDRYLGLRADALRQLEQQIPCRDAGNVAAGHHGQKRLELFGHLDRHHVQSEDIRDIHGLAGVDHVIAVRLAVAAGEVFRIGDISCPRKGSVAARGVVKVENCLIGAVHGDLDRSTDRVVPRNHGRDGHIAQTGLLAAGKGKAIVRSFHSTCCAVAQFKCDIACAHSDGILVIGCNQRKAYRISVNGVDARFGEFQAIRLDHGKRLAADHRVTGQELNFHAAFLDGGENTIFRDGTDGFIRGLPCDIGREFRRAAGHTDTGSDQADCGAARQVIISRGDQGMIKLRRDRGRGDHHQRGTNGTLITIRRTVHNRERIAAFLLRYEGSGTAAVQIDGSHAARVQHDLCQLFGAAACGERLLPSVKHHEDDLALGSDAHAGAGMAAVIIVGRAIYDRPAVFDKIHAAADGLLDLILIGVVFTGAADHGRAILQDRKEARRCAAVVFDTLHDQRAVGSAVRHVIEVRVDADHSIVVLHKVRCVGRIRMPRLRSGHLVGYAGHRPALRGVVRMVVCKDLDIAAGNIGGRDVIDDLLVVLGQRIVDRLRHAGSNCRCIRREHRVVCVIRLRIGFRVRIGIGVDRVGAVRIARKVKEIICKSVAARFTQRLIVGKVGQRIGALQRTDQGIPGISAQNLAPDTVLGDHAAQTVGQEVGSTACICRPCGEVVLDDRAQSHTAAVHLRGEIEGVHIAIEVGIGKRMIDLIERAVGHAEVSCAKIRGEGIHVSLRGIHLVSDIHVFRAVHQIRDITGPAAHIGAGQHNGIRHALHLRIVRHVHRAEHMTEVGRIAVGQRKVLNALQRGGRSAVCGVLLGNVGGEGSILLAADHFPSAGGVPLHACTDIVDDQRTGILTGIFFRIGLGIAFQNFEAGKEARIVRNLGKYGLVRRVVRLRLSFRFRLVQRERRLFEFSVCGIFVVCVGIVEPCLVRRKHTDRQQRGQQHDCDQAYRQIPFQHSSRHFSLSLCFILNARSDNLSPPAWRRSGSAPLPPVRSPPAECQHTDKHSAASPRCPSDCRQRRCRRRRSRSGTARRIPRRFLSQM